MHLLQTHVLCLIAVLKPVAPHTMVAGSPAKPVGTVTGACFGWAMLRLTTFDSGTERACIQDVCYMHHLSMVLRLWIKFHSNLQCLCQLGVKPVVQHTTVLGSPAKPVGTVTGGCWVRGWAMHCAGLGQRWILQDAGPSERACIIGVLPAPLAHGI
jgi:hypothetical protein